jgi:hypothetical protein
MQIDKRLTFEDLPVGAIFKGDVNELHYVKLGPDYYCYKDDEKYTWSWSSTGSNPVTYLGLNFGKLIKAVAEKV